MLKKLSLSLLLLAALATQPACAADAPSAVLPEKYFDFFHDYCLSCHDSIAAEGDVDLEAITFDLGLGIQAAETWQKVLNAINAGEMPPESEDQPTSKEKADFLEALSGRLVTARDILADSGGVITMRRLNRREYANTLRDLLGVEVNVDSLPIDTSSGGFDTNGSSLFFSSDQFENYMAIARTALDEAIVTGSRPTKQINRVQAEIDGKPFFQAPYNKLLNNHDRYLAWKKSEGRPATDFGFNDHVLAQGAEDKFLEWSPSYRLILDNPLLETGALLGMLLTSNYSPRTGPPPNAPPGRYILRARVAHLESTHPLPDINNYLVCGAADVNQLDKHEIRLLGARRITGSIDAPQIVEFPVDITEHGPRSFTLRMRLPNKRSAVRRMYQSFYDEFGRGPDPTLWIDWLEWEGPLVEQWPPAAHQALFFRGEDADESDDYARAIIKRFGSRAFRTRPPSKTFVDRLMGFYRERLDAGEPFTEAIKKPLSILLASPGFLYVAEPSEDARHSQLSQEALAVRLAYFLWSGPPDTELLTLAKQGKLADPETLRAQTDRLISDPRANAFIEGFAYQWLAMERIELFQFNASLYPTFDHTVREAARQEIYHTLRHLLLDEQPLGQLLKADYVVVNDLLADYYDIPGVHGAEFRPIRVPDGLPRGGLLGTAAVLAIGSDGERSSPVERGAWVLRKLLNDPPPPAPANVPELSRFEEELLDARALQTAHMEQPQCAQCHRKIDPIGFGMENFDAAGKWRESVTLSKKRRNGTYAKGPITIKIDPSGTLPNGAAFADFFEMRDHIANHKEDFARGFTEALIEYGLGRSYGFTDRDLADRVLNYSHNKNFNTRAFIHALVLSEEFQRK